MTNTANSSWNWTVNDASRELHLELERRRCRRELHLELEHRRRRRELHLELELISLLHPTRSARRVTPHSFGRLSPASKGPTS